MKKNLSSVVTVLGFLAAISICFPATARSAGSYSGDYFGAASIDSPAGLGNVDLAFHLEVDNNTSNIVADSYIILDKTVLFPVVAPKVNNQDVGPRVNGQVGATQFSLTTQLFDTTLHGIDDNKTITHQITLTGDTFSEGGSSIAGTYTETMTGYFANPVTVVGSFVLVRPVSVTKGYPVCQDFMAPSGQLTIEEIRAGGKDPSVVEFEDLDCAMRYYRGLTTGLTVSKSTLEQAISEYHNYLNGQQQ